MSKKDVDKTFNKLNEPAAVTDKDGTKIWYNKDGELHRENDLPAVIWADGGKQWYINGVLHRVNGPAVIYRDGTKKWFINEVYVPTDSALTFVYALVTYYAEDIKYRYEKIMFYAILIPLSIISVIIMSIIFTIINERCAFKRYLMQKKSIK